MNDSTLCDKNKSLKTPDNFLCVTVLVHTKKKKKKKTRKKVHVPVSVCICVSVDRGLYCGVGVDRGLYCGVCVRGERWMCDRECVDYCVILSAPPPPLCVMYR